MKYVRDGSIYGVRCTCGAALLLETAGAKVEKGVDLIEHVQLTLHASAVQHLKEKNAD